MNPACRLPQMCKTHAAMHCTRACQVGSCQAVSVSHEYRPAAPLPPDYSTIPVVSAEPLQGFCRNVVFAVAYTGLNGACLLGVKGIPVPSRSVARYRATLHIQGLYASFLHTAANLRWKVGRFISAAGIDYFPASSPWRNFTINGGKC